MSSDDAYSSFLDQANQSTGTSKGSATSNSTKAVDTNIPASLQDVNQYYVSETDEPFEPVALNWSGKNMPSESEFKELIRHGSDVAALSLNEFDPQGRYKDIFKAVENATGGKSSVYRVHHGNTRAEYYVVGFDEKGKKVVGLKAKAVET